MSIRFMLRKLCNPSFINFPDVRHCRPSCSQAKHIVFIHQHRVYKAKFGNAGGDLRHLCVRMRRALLAYGTSSSSERCLIFRLPMVVKIERVLKSLIFYGKIINMTTKPTDIFGKDPETAAPGTHGAARQVLNYIWISKEKQEETANPEEPENPMMEKYSNNVSCISNANPDVDVLLWVDNHLLNSSQRIFLENLSSAHPNLSVRDLNEIPKYREDPIFSKSERLPHDECEPIWQKVDFARVVVLDHVLATEDAAEVYYSDLDIVDPHIASDAVQSILNNHGMVFAKCDRNGRNEVAYLENQFMGFRRKAADFVSDRLLPVVKEEIDQGKNGWPPLCRCVRERFSGINRSLNTVTVKTRELAGPNSMGWMNVGTGIVWLDQLTEGDSSVRKHLSIPSDFLKGLDFNS